MRWQLVRVSNRTKELTDKIQTILDFYFEFPNWQNKDRALNYLKGLNMAVKSEDVTKAFVKIQNSAETMKEDTDIKIQNVSTEQLLILYKDLLKRNKQWLKGNYRNYDLNMFLKDLYEELTARGEILERNYDRFPKGKTTHRFIY